MAAPRLLAYTLLFVSVQLATLAAAQSEPADAVSLTTKDGVQLHLTYFPAAQRKGTEAKQATPVVLLHDVKETRAVFNSLAEQLQGFGGGRQKAPSFA